MRAADCNGPNRGWWKCLPLLSVLFLARLLETGGQQADVRWPREYVSELVEESPGERQARHDLIKQRRSGPILMVHRGAAAMAPENSLQAYAAAMDYGADGCEVDIRRTSDGTLVLFHDEMLDRLTVGFGRVKDVSYRELCALRPRTVFGRPVFGIPPTFVVLLNLARQRAMLLHLDLKEPGLEDEVARWLDAADAWEHVVAINSYYATNLLQNPKLRLLNYKAPGLYENRLDVDLEAVRVALAKPGQMLLVDDPRTAAHVLGRKPYDPWPLVRTYRLVLNPVEAIAPATSNAFRPMHHLLALARRADSIPESALLRLLEKETAQAEPGKSDGGAQAPTAREIVERAWAIQQLTWRGRTTPELIGKLQEIVQHPTAHEDLVYHGLDAAEAARALGGLRAIDAVPALIDAFCQKGLADAGQPAWVGYRPKMCILGSLGDLPCGTAKRFLRQYVGWSETKAQELGPPQFGEATQALMRQRLSWAEIAALLRSPNLTVRGTVVLECLDDPTEERRLALKRAAPWALELPGRRK